MKDYAAESETWVSEEFDGIDECVYSIVSFTFHSDPLKASDDNYTMEIKSEKIASIQWSFEIFLSDSDSYSYECL